MSKVTDQASGVVAGTMDVSTQSEQDVAHPTDAAAVLERRRLAGTRARKHAALVAKQSAAAGTATADPSRTKR